MGVKRGLRCAAITVAVLVVMTTLFYACEKKRPDVVVVEGQGVVFTPVYELNSEKYRYELTGSEIKNIDKNDGYILLDKLTAAFDGQNLTSITGKVLELTTNKQLEAKLGLSVKIPFSFIDVTVGGEVRGTYTETYTIGNVSLSGQLVNGLKKGQIVEFYYRETLDTIAVYRISDEKHITDLYQPRVTFDAKIYSVDEIGALSLAKDLGEPWSPGAAVADGDAGESAAALQDSYLEEYIEENTVDSYTWEWRDDWRKTSKDEPYEIDGVNASTMVLDEIITACGGFRLGLQLDYGEAGYWDIWVYKGDGGWFDKVGSVYISGKDWCYGDLTFSTRNVALIAITPYVGESGWAAPYGIRARIQNVSAYGGR